MSERIDAPHGARASTGAMNVCPHCQTPNPPERRYCANCTGALGDGAGGGGTPRGALRGVWGGSLGGLGGSGLLPTGAIDIGPGAIAGPAEPPAAAEAASVQTASAPPSAEQLPQRAGSTPWTGVRRSIPLDELFGSKTSITVGRGPECDLQLSHPMVSRRHAVLERVPGGLRMRDVRLEYEGADGARGPGAGQPAQGPNRPAKPVVIHESERFAVGPVLFVLRHGAVEAVDSAEGLRLEARELVKRVKKRDGSGEELTILDHINLVVQPGEFVSLLGPSGSGKSTLMNCLNGRSRATSGRVLANGEDFYEEFDHFRQLLGYVPQKDIVHYGLTVQRALYYTAKLRLPPDTDEGELNDRVDEVIRQMELDLHREKLVSSLSGGQVKRVSLGAELVGRPSLMYIDEATSGLDAGTESRMMRLFRQLADEGTSVVCVTHNVENVDRCHLMVMLAGGKLMFYGPPEAANDYFEVKRLTHVYEVLGRRKLNEWEERYKASSLFKEYVADRIAAYEAVSGAEAKADAEATVRIESEAKAADGNGRQAAPEADATTTAAPADGGAAPVCPPGGRTAEVAATLAAPKRPPRRRAWPARVLRMARLRYIKRYRQARKLLTPVRDGWHQFRVLTARYTELTLADRRSLRLLLLQAPIVAGFILLGFIGKPYDTKTWSLRKPEPHEYEMMQNAMTRLPEGSAKQWLAGVLDPDRAFVPYLMTDPRYTYLLLNIMILAVFWFGCSNAAKEIVKEEAVYARERSVNLKIVPYLGSKFMVLGVVSAIQVLLLMVVIYGVLEGLGALMGHSVPAHEYRLGDVPEFFVLLLLSLTCTALGLLLSACVSSPDRANALLPYVLIPQIILGGGLLPIKGTALQALSMAFSPVYWAYRAMHLGAHRLPASVPAHVDYPDDPWLPCIALTIQLGALLLLTAWFLRRKDECKG